MSNRQTTSRNESERGSAVVSFVILAPALILMVLLLVQVTIASHVRHVLSQAAATGAAEAAAWDSSALSGQQRADELLAGASGWIMNPAVIVSRNSQTAAAITSADAFQVLPFGNWHIEIQRSVPVEKFDE